MNRKGKVGFTLVALWLIGFTFTASSFINFAMQERVAFRNDFGFDIETVYVASTFENMRSGLVNIKNTINTKMSGNPSTIYSTVIPWAKTPDNTLQMNIRVIDMCIERIDVSMAYYQTYRQNATASLVNDWYSTTLNNIKTGFEGTSTFTYLEGAYTIVNYGWFGDVSIHLFWMFACVFLICALITYDSEIADEDLDSEYQITYTRDGQTNNYTVHAWTESGARRMFDEKDSRNKIMRIDEIV